MHAPSKTPKIVLPIDIDDMTESHELRYDGSGTSDDASDFLKSLNLIHRKSRPPLTDADKLVDVADRFRTNSSPDRWFRAQNFGGSWSAFVTAFQARFASVSITIKPLGERLEELHNIKIKEGDLVGPNTVVFGGVMTPFDQFCGRLREAVLDAGAGASSEGLWGFHKALPRSFRAEIPLAPADWNGMLAALQVLPEHAVEEAVCERKQALTVASLEKKGAMLDAKSAALDAKMMQVDRLMAGMVVTGAQRAPGMEQRAAGTGNARAALRAANAGGGRLALPMATAETRVELERAWRESSARQHPDTPAGKAAYAADVRSWSTRNPSATVDTAPLWKTGYPITPGTHKPRSGECWTCGMRTTPTHYRSCTSPPVPELEKRFRALCGMWLGIDPTTRAAAQPLAVVAVNVVEAEVEDEGVPWWREEDGESVERREVFD
ncbi:hypothetical protein FB45DRAFT_1020205 [Roridomyces roridus]|uniref:Uncharacterized protein n=1 Tax=Roridomyces roridus TaxID=1738132 RepID=A0AAD7CGL7_9AGAR|nr:hypothetical protein FB45DRAFT_1020205 [Roridomyces roridus]